MLDEPVRELRAGYRLETRVVFDLGSPAHLAAELIRNHGHGDHLPNRVDGGSQRRRPAAEDEEIIEGRWIRPPGRLQG